MIEFSWVPIENQFKGDFSTCKLVTETVHVFKNSLYKSLLTFVIVSELGVGMKEKGYLGFCKTNLLSLCQRQ